MKTKNLSSFLLIVSIGLSACGFHLKNESSFKGSIHEVTLVSENIDPAFIHALKRELQEAGINVNTSADYQLRILRYEESRRAISNNNLSAKPTETQLNYRLGFSLMQESELLIAPTNLQRSKEYPNNNADIAGMLDEERILSEAAQEELIELLMRRLATYKPAENTLNQNSSGH